MVDLAGIPKKEDLDGESLVDLLKNTSMNWDRPVLYTYGKANHALGLVNGVIFNIVTDQTNYIIIKIVLISGIIYLKKMIIKL